MAEQTCKDCEGQGMWLVDMGDSVSGCGTCDGTGAIHRTGPYRLADGTWSDGVDRSKRVWATYFAMKNKGRWHVYKGFPDFFTGYEWRVYSDRGFLRYFKTQEEAIAYADRTARTTKNGDNK